MLSETLHFETPRLALQLLGNDPANLSVLQQELGIKAVARGAWIRLEGPPEAVGRARELLRALEERVRNGGAVRRHDFSQALAVVKDEGGETLAALDAERIRTSSGKAVVSPKTPGQKRYIEAIRRHSLTFAIGPAGTGKTYLAMAMAVSALRAGEARRLHHARFGPQLFHCHRAAGQGLGAPGFLPAVPHRALRQAGLRAGRCHPCRADRRAVELRHRHVQGCRSGSLFVSVRELRMRAESGAVFADGLPARRSACELERVAGLSCGGDTGREALTEPAQTPVFAVGRGTVAADISTARRRYVVDWLCRLCYRIVMSGSAGRRASVLVIVAAVLWGSAVASADKLTFQNGGEITGRIVSEGQEKVVIDTRYGRLSFPREQIVSITYQKLPPEQQAPTLPDAVEAPSGVAKSGSPGGYYEIAVRGVIGSHVRSSLFKACLQEARRLGAHTVVLRINSPGGSVAEVEQMISAVADNGDLRFVAVCEGQVLSAAAILALSCRDIFVSRDACIGAATPYKTTGGGLPAPLQEKFLSAWRATCRTAAELGKHQPILAEAMVDPRVELYVTTENGRPVVRPGRGGQQLTTDGKLLTLTSSEAIRCGLARGRFVGVEQLGSLLKEKPWKPLNGPARKKLLAHISSAEKAGQRLKKLLQTARTAMQRGKAIDPTRYSYEVYRGTRLFTAAGGRDWRRRTDLCLAALSKAELPLKQAQNLLKEYPHLGSEALMQLLKDLDDSISAYRTYLKEHRNSKYLPQ